MSASFAACGRTYGAGGARILGVAQSPEQSRKKLGVRRIGAES